jgi:hypothetical protein
VHGTAAHVSLWVRAYAGVYVWFFYSISMYIDVVSRRPPCGFRDGDDPGGINSYR